MELFKRALKNINVKQRIKPKQTTAGERRREREGPEEGVIEHWKFDCTQWNNNWSETTGAKNGNNISISSQNRLSPTHRSDARYATYTHYVREIENEENYPWELTEKETTKQV